jgi:hypothetical protein
MRDFKFFKDNDTQLGFPILANGFLTIQPQIRFDDVEFCFQFNDDEPVVFASGTNECNITINPTTQGNITFNDNNNAFKIFARERQ